MRRGGTSCAPWTRQGSPEHGSNTMKIAAMAYGDFRQARQQRYFPKRFWTVIPEDRNALKSSIGGADMDEIRSILLSWVSMSSVLTYRERLLPSRALLISSGKKVVFRLLEVPAFTLAICAPFLGAELDKEFAPSSPIEFFIC